MAAFLDEIGVVPVIAATGAAGMNFEERLASLLHNTEIIETPKNLVEALRTTSRRKIRKETKVMAEADFAEILEASADLKPDFVIGNSKGYYLARQLEIPLVRCGFPIHDRIGGHRILHLGYRGTLNLFERICNALMEAKQNQAKSGWTYI